ncbi:MAG: hypothetical protein E3J29_06675 [Dehalococcoidia bacterium]|nr:MAG: hypothetical protein E3J29_06675 [Dehalococcoidia bacterium]
MARTELTVKVAIIASPGVDIGAGTNVLAANDGMFVNDGKTILKIVNGSGLARDIIFITPITHGAQDLAVADHTVTIPGSATRYVGPFPPGTYNQITGDDIGKVHFDVAEDDLTLTAIRTP